jgi:PspAA-like protein
MIVRIATEGQYEVGESDSAELQALDDDAVKACESGDEGHFQASYAKLLAFVRANGTSVDHDHLGGSDLILPPPDVTLEEARAEFSAEGLIPD